jgi:HlyD family secretion protein
MRLPLKKKLIIPLVILLLLAGALSLLFFYFRSQRGAQELQLTGTVEVTEVEISPELSAQVMALYHWEGDEVKQGDPLLDLDKSIVGSQLRAAKAASQAAEAQTLLARAKMENAERDYNRYLQLYEAKAIAPSVYDAYKTSYTVAKNTYAASLEQFKTAQAQATTLQVQLQKTHIVSPINGVVLDRSVEAGEVVFPGIVLMTIGDIRNSWVRVYIGEPDIGKVRIGQKALVVTDAYPTRQFPGTLRYIASEAEFTPKNVQTREERIKLVYEAKVYLSNEEGILKPGMPADVTIRLEK